MKRVANLSYKAKLVLVYGITIVMIVFFTSTALTFAAQRQVMEDKMAHLHLLAEQMLINFERATASAVQQLINMISSKGVAFQLYEMRDLEPSKAGYYQSWQNVVYAINQTITAQTYYDQVYVCQLENDTRFTNYSAPDDFIRDASALLENELYGKNHYGSVLWVRTENGNLYMVRDIYHSAPLRRVGKVVARVRQDMLSSLGTSNDHLNCTVAFLEEKSGLVTIIGAVAPGMETAATAAALQGLNRMESNGNEYLLSVQTQGRWTAVGMLSAQTLDTVSRTVSWSGYVVGFMGILFGSLVVMTVTGRLTRQVHKLASGMDEVAAGNMDVTVPVESKDEIGRLATHFNSMIRQTRELLGRVVNEQRRKSQMEYEMLEYKYRSLQSQINPHFIYNAMETVNALAKMSGNQEICEVVQHISAFFRQNTGNMQKRFIPLRREFDSLKQYAYIYRHIHGDTLSAYFECTKDAADGLVPTMVLQPVLENALVHGIRPASDEAVIRIVAIVEEEDMLIHISDNGNGMPPEMVEAVLGSKAAEVPEASRTSAGIGMRNVRDRLTLIYGQRAAFEIQSELGRGTTVSIRIPLVYDERDFEMRTDVI